MKEQRGKWVVFKYTKTSESFKLKETNWKEDRYAILDPIPYINNKPLTKAIESLMQAKRIHKMIPYELLNGMDRIDVNPYIKISNSFLKAYL